MWIIYVVVVWYQGCNGISQRMRILARLYIILQEKNKQGNSLVDFLKPDTFDLLLSCTKELGGFSYQTTEGEKVACFSKPSLPLKIGYSLEKCAMILKGIGIKTRKPYLIRNTEDFLELYKLEWTPQISSVCLKPMDANKFNKVMLLPLMEDIMKVRSSLKKRIPVLTKQVSDSPTLEDWRALAEAQTRK